MKNAYGSADEALDGMRIAAGGPSVAFPSC